MKHTHLSTTWFEFCLLNKGKVTPEHTSMYFYFLNNAMVNNEINTLPLNEEMEVLGIKSEKKYKKCYTDLYSWGFVNNILKDCM